MAQQVFYHDPNAQIYYPPEAYKLIDNVTAQTASLSLNDGQLPLVASVKVDPLLPSYDDLASPTPAAAPVAPKRIARKPVGGVKSPVHSPQPSQNTIPVNILAQTTSTTVAGVPSYQNVPVASSTTASPPYAPVPPITNVLAYAPTVPLSAVPTYESLNTIPSPPSSPSTVHSPVFSPITPSTTNTTIPTSPTSPTFPPVPPAPVGGYPRLVKPIVIPQVLNHTTHADAIGKPFIRCYAKVLSNFNLDQDSFLDFLDELNIDQAGHVGFDYTRKAGKAIHLAGQFDPTGITKLVGSSVALTASLGEVAYMKGPVSKKKLYIDRANKEIFTPRGLKASVVTGKQLRKILGLEPKHPLNAPLMTGWIVPTKEQLLKGQRAKCRVAGRIIYHLLQHVEDVVLAKEANETLMVTGSIAQKKAAKHVRDWQVGSEVQHELWRTEALALYARAKNAGTEKERQKLLKRAAQVDKELIHVEKISWLVVQNLDAINPLVTV